MERSPVIMKVAITWPNPSERGVGDRPTTNPTSFSRLRPIRIAPACSSTFGVADIAAVYDDWRRKGAQFLTEPKDHGREILLVNVRDPDGHLIEVGQATGLFDDM